MFDFILQTVVMFFLPAAARTLTSDSGEYQRSCLRSLHRVRWSSKSRKKYLKCTIRVRKVLAF